MVAIISMNKINKMDRTLTYILLTNKRHMDTIRKKLLLFRINDVYRLIFNQWDAYQLGEKYSVL